MKKIFAIFMISLATQGVFATVTLPKLFGDNMVLQRNAPITIWGWANAGEKITVQFNNQKKSITTPKTGKWQLQLNAESAGGPYQLSVSGKNTITFQNVLVGEVWICSGQSNMEMPIAGWGMINNYKKEIENANYPQIRQFDVPNTVSGKELDDVSGGNWQVCSPATAGEFSATAYFFARKLYEELHVPVGLINSTWGGTQSESWTSMESFAACNEFKEVAAQMQGKTLEEIVQHRNDAVVANIIKAQGSTDERANAAQWKNPAYDDSKWVTMALPADWEDRGFPGLDGEAWFRKTIVVSEADAGKPAVLELSKIDDEDITYVNGQPVGHMEKWDEPRTYAIPAGVLKAGKNVIAVRVTDTQGGGGIYGDAPFRLTIGKTEIALTGDWLFRVESIKEGSGSGIGPNDFPAILYNAMIHPLLPVTFKGVIWYQGETNADRAYQYRTAFPLMITDWRKHFNQGDFPFLFVQLSTFGSADANSTNGSAWAELREAQAMTLSLPHTGMAVTTDIGNPKDIHPKNKQEVGRRLALIALHDVYEQQQVYSGPVYQAMRVNSGSVELSFAHTDNGWMVQDRYGYIKGFEMAGADKKFHYAKAELRGDKIIVYCNEVAEPAAVRYNWCDDASEGNVFNKSGLPLAPFRTDDWEGITRKNSFHILQ